MPSTSMFDPTKTVLTVGLGSEIAVAGIPHLDLSIPFGQSVIKTSFGVGESRMMSPSETAFLYDVWVLRASVEEL